MKKTLVRLSGVREKSEKLFLFCAPYINLTRLCGMLYWECLFLMLWYRAFSQVQKLKH